MLDLWFAKCDPQTGSISISWELVRRTKVAMVSTLKGKRSQVICLTNVNIPQRYFFIRLSNLDIFSDNKMTAEISAVKVHSKANCVKGDLKVERDYV